MRASKQKVTVGVNPEGNRMSINNERIEIKAISPFEWLAFKRANLRFFGDDPEIKRASFLQRLLFFRMVRKKAENYFCKVNEQRAGMLSIRTDLGSEVFIYGVAVEPEFRRKGLGKRMMIFTEERAKELGKKFIGLGVKCSNELAIKLYKKLGYKILGEGITHISVPIKEIKSKEKYSLILTRVLRDDPEWKSYFIQFLLREIEAVSNIGGVEYVMENRLERYYEGIQRLLSKGGQMFRIFDGPNAVGCLFYTDKGETRRVMLYSNIKYWNIDFIQDLASNMMVLPRTTSEINTLRFRLSIHRANKTKKLDKAPFTRDRLVEKYLMFKTIEK